MQKTYIDLLQFPIIHGRHLCNEVLTNMDISKNSIEVSDDIQILTVVDKPNVSQNLLSKMSFKKAKVHTIIIEK